MDARLDEFSEEPPAWGKPMAAEVLKEEAFPPEKEFVLLFFDCNDDNW